jgi:hypothetical protein
MVSSVLTADDVLYPLTMYITVALIFRYRVHDLPRVLQCLLKTIHFIPTHCAFQESKDHRGADSRPRSAYIHDSPVESPAS